MRFDNKPATEETERRELDRTAHGRSCYLTALGKQIVNLLRPQNYRNNLEQLTGTGL
jgi:hypothetical protein